MKRIILFILLIPLVSAIYGGETEVIHHFDKCSSLDVIVSGTLEINKTEYSFLNCSEKLENEWECNCYDGFDLIMETKVNTINNYSIDMTYSYGEITTTTSVSYSSGRTNWICGSWSECKNENKTIFCYKEFNRGINYTNTEPCDMEIIDEPIKEPTKEPENKTIILEPENKTLIVDEEPELEEPEPRSYKLLIIISIVLLIIITFVIIIVIINRRN